MFMLRSTCVLFSLPCLCLDLSLSALCLVHVSRSTCWLLCHVLLKPFYLLSSPFSCVLALLVGCRSILWSRPTSIHLGLYQKVWIISFMCVYIGFLAFMLYIHVCLSRSRLCHAFALCGFMLVGL